MTQVDQVGFSCAACGKQYRWKPELAGKSVKCKCGSPMAVPRRAGQSGHAGGGVGGAGASAGAATSHGSATGPGLAAAARSAEVPPRAAAAAAAARPAAAKPAKVAAPPPPPPAPKKAVDEEIDFDGLYALAEDSEKKSTGAQDAPYNAVGNGGGGVPLAAAGAAAPLAYAGTGGAAVALPWGVRPIVKQDQVGSRGFNADNLIYEGSKFRNVFLPAILIAVGLCFYVGQFAFAGGAGAKFAAGALAVYILLNAFVDAVLILGALIICVKFLDMGFGALGPAILKIFAIAIGPTAIGDILLHVLAKPMGGFGALVTAGVVAIVLYYTLIKVFFDLDLGETLLLTGIIYMLQRWVKFFLVMGLVATLMSGAGSDDEDDDGGGGITGGIAAAAIAGGGGPTVDDDPDDNNAPVGPPQDPRVMEMVSEQAYKELGINPDFASSDQHNRVRTHAHLRATTMPSAEKEKLIAIVDERRAKEELIGLLVDECLDDIRKVNPGANVIYESIYDQMRSKVERMPPEQQKTERARLIAKAKADEKAFREKQAKEKAAAAADGLDAGDEEMVGDEEDEDAPAVPGAQVPAADDGLE